MIQCRERLLKIRKVYTPWSSSSVPLSMTLNIGKCIARIGVKLIGLSLSGLQINTSSIMFSDLMLYQSAANSGRPVFGRLLLAFFLVNGSLVSQSPLQW